MNMVPMTHLWKKIVKHILTFYFLMYSGTMLIFYISMIWYGIRMLWYAMTFQCHAMKFLCYAMVNVVKDKHTATVFIAETY